MTRHLKPDERDQLAAELAKQYAAGASLRQLAASHGRSANGVRDLLRHAGAQMRPRGGTPKSRTTTQKGATQ